MGDFHEVVEVEGQTLHHGQQAIFLQTLTQTITTTLPGILVVCEMCIAVAAATTVFNRDIKPYYWPDLPLPAVFRSPV